MEFKRLNKNSKIIFCSRFGPESLGAKIIEIENQHLILQIVNVPFVRDTSTIDNDYFIIEYISKLEETMLDETKSKHDIDFENYLETTINKDPFGGKYSGMKLKTIFEQGDKQWLETALREMKNEFIKDRLRYIVERGGYGKIIY